MPNIVSCVLTFTSLSFEEVEKFISVHKIPETDMKRYIQGEYYIIRFDMHQKPFYPEDLTPEKGFPFTDYVRLAWSEPRLLGYGWWWRYGKHTETHTYSDPGIDEDGKPLGDYRDFLIDHIFSVGP